MINFTKHSGFRWFAGLSLFFALLNPIQAAEQQTSQDKTVQKIFVSTGFTAPISTYYSAIVAEIDKLLPNVEIYFEELTAERSIDLVNRGVNDIECCRIPAVVNKAYENLVAVNESFLDAKFAAFSKNPDLNIKSFEDLKPYSVGTVVGWKILVNNLERIEPKAKYIVATPKQMMLMLQKDRIDVALLGYESGLQALREIGLHDAHAYLDPPLAVKPLYLVLHKKNQHLIPDLDNAIRQLKANGTVERLYKQHFLTDTE